MDTYILGIESSCDETAAAVVKNGREVLSNVINTQIDIHKKYGGVVPEIASRKHIENIDGVIDEALALAGKTLDEIDAVAVTAGLGHMFQQQLLKQDAGVHILHFPLNPASTKDQKIAEELVGQLLQLEGLLAAGGNVTASLLFGFEPATFYDVQIADEGC
jgi:N-acetylglucosamine kinase-like BadF-type ATPase